MGGRQRTQHVLISANKGAVSFFSLLFCLLVPWGKERCWLFALLLSSGWQNGLLGNLSGQVGEPSAASSVTVFPPLVFTFCLFAKWKTWTPLFLLYCTHFFLFFPLLCSLSSAHTTNTNLNITFTVIRDSFIILHYRVKSFANKV